MNLSEIKDNILNILFPKVCFSCQRDIPAEEKDILCLECVKKLVYINKPYCEICGIKIDGGSLCYNCKRRSKKFNFEFSRSVFMYGDEISSLIIAWKYRRIDWLTDWFSAKIIEGLKDHREFDSYDYITYIPLHYKKLRKRGFNQTELLAAQISKKSGLKLIKDSVEKIIDSKSQTKLSANEREENIRGVFKVIKPDEIKFKKIILIDDVATTMSTLNEMAGVLLKSGAEKVSCFTIARE